MKRHRLIVAVATALSTVLVAACSGSSSTKTSSPPLGGPSSTLTGAGTSSASAGAIDQDPNHRVVVVNLHLDGGAGGPAYDVYQVPSDVRDVTPAVQGLAYAATSQPVSLGRKHSNYNTGDYGVTLVPAGGTSSQETPWQGPGYDTWTTAIAVIGGSGPSATMTLFPDTGATDSGAFPASVNGKASVIATAAFVGDQNAGSNLTDTVLFGPSGSCLASTNPRQAGDPASAVGPQNSYAFAAGTASVGFWTTTKNQYAPGDCTGTPLATADVSSLAAGSRALVILYGPSKDTISTLVVPLPH